ncbi:MAG: S49 family peptidase, partial [Pirellulaceae bacterium]|nr:S49 family peptidase [Pirellulaceae bacterium]
MRSGNWVGLVLCVTWITWHVSPTTTPAWSQDQAARPADAPAPSPDPVASKPAQKPSDKRTEKSTDKAAAKAVAAPTIRLIELSGQYVDLVTPLGLDPASLLMGGESLKQKSFYKLCDYLDNLGRDAQVSHVVFDLSDAGLSFNPAQLDEITRHLEKLKTSGKQMIAWLENPSNVQLAIAVTCHEIVLADFGGVDMPSVGMQSMFYRDAMDLIGVQASVVRAGDFKGAVEPYLNPQM